MWNKALAVFLGVLIGAPLMIFAQDWYEATGKPVQRGSLNSADLRTEFASIESDIADKLPALTGNGGKLIRVNSGGTALEAVTTGLDVAAGGTGVVTLTGIVQGNGTSDFTGITSSTAGQVLRVTGSNAFAFGALDLEDSDAITGDLPLAAGGTGASLSDPNADRIMFWDDSAGSTAYLTVGSGLSISDTTITADGSGTVTSVGGTGTVNGLTLTGTVTSSGSLTLGGTLAINNSDWSGTDLSVANGGTGASTLTGLLQGNGTSAFTAITNSTTVGQLLRVTGSNTYGWGALNLADSDAITGDLPDANLSSNVPLLNAANTFTNTTIVDVGGGNDELTVSSGAVAMIGTVTIGGNAVWHAGNDGSGSGLDADTLDGNSSAAFQSADADLTAIAALAKSDGNFIVGNGSTWVAESGSTALASLGAASSSTTISVSGTGLSGGGSLAANRTITIDQTAMTTRNISGKSGVAKTLSTSDPSGGSDGDIWYKYVE